MCNISRSVLPCDTSVGLCCHVQLSVGQCCHVIHQLVCAAMCKISWSVLPCATSEGQ
ncbi:hypothetical protein DPMN_001999 [Dreissena polymorpha]|uniref:Uncharacterized protein n=1 Tax=Dreissena polymorpha TaxID=45954 RepID=A0A9D4RTE6_DREPO|nr:hypothetical protein DPMN_001999 [Dreissena polymorpha]